jgi:ankyrin repeat protein
LLLSRGASVNVQTKNCITALRAATQKGYVKVFEVLLEYNADVNCTVKNDITAQKGDSNVTVALHDRS